MGKYEESFGIIEFINNVAGFTGTIKFSPQDFLVNEIDLDGNVVYVTDQDYPKQEIHELKKLLDPLDDEFEEQVQLLIDEAHDGNFKHDTVTTKVSYMNKDMRSAIHHALKSKIGECTRVSTQTTPEMHIQVIKSHKKIKKRTDWKRLGGEYLMFHMEKTNTDSCVAVKLLSSHLKVPFNSIGIAGTKDKRGVTCQRVTIKHVLPQDLLALKLRNIKIGNFKFVNSSLRLGDLSSNQFTLTVRFNATDTSCKTIRHCFDNVKTNGVVNYFGCQRFGTGSVPTWKLGCCLLHLDFQGLIDLLLEPRGEDDVYDAARKVFKNTPNLAYQAFPPNAIAERAVLSKLSEGVEQAVMAIPWTLRSMYLHSYQSLVWNRATTHRLRDFPRETKKGDFVLLNNEVLIVQKDGEYSINDVCLPLPGYDVEYPSFMLPFYQSILKEQNFEMPFGLSSKEVYLPGRQRPIILMPRNMTLNFEDDINTASAKMSFELQSSSYATMVLRELMRVETSASADAERSIWLFN